MPSDTLLMTIATVIGVSLLLVIAVVVMVGLTAREIIDADDDIADWATMDGSVVHHAQQRTRDGEPDGLGCAEEGVGVHAQGNGR
jgi:hypothetical protein